MVRVDEKWIWGEGGQKSPKMSGRLLYTVPISDILALKPNLGYGSAGVPRLLLLFAESSGLWEMTRLGTKGTATALGVWDETHSDFQQRVLH